MDYLGHIHENSSLKYMCTFLTMTEVVVIFGNFLLSKSLECPCTYPGVCWFVFVFCGLQLLESTRATLPGTFTLCLYVCVGGKEASL